MLQEEAPRTFGISEPDSDAVPGGTTQVEGSPDPAQTAAWDFQDALPGLLLVGGVMLASLVLMRAAWRSAAKNKAASRAPSNQPEERLETIRTDAAARAAIENFESDAEELTQRLSAVLDNKAARLELLIQDANSALERLTRGIAETERLPRMSGPASEPERPTATPESHFADPAHREICELADAGSSADEIAARLDRAVGEIELVLNLNGRRHRRGA